MTSWIIWAGRVVGLREVGRHLAVLLAILLHEGRVLRRVQRGAVLQRRDVADDLVAHGGQRELVVARPAADHGLLVAGSRQLLGELQRHRPDHEREDRVRVLLHGRNEGPEVDRSERRPDLLDDLAAAGFERLLEPADGLVAEGIVGGDRHDALVSLLAGPLPERMGGLGARPAGAHEVGILVGVALRQIIRGRNRRRCRPSSRAC